MPKVCFVGGARYHQPLDETSEKKFRALQQLGEMHVIGFSVDRKPRHFVQHARFYLLPQWRSPALRYLSFLVAGPIIILSILKRHNLKILVAQSPYEGLAAALAKILASFIFGIKLALIVESHGDFEDSVFLQGKIRFTSLHRTFMKRIAGFTLHRADALRGVSQATRKKLQAWAPGKPTTHFPAWTDIKVFLRMGEKGKPILRDRTILYVGNLQAGKGVHLLLDSFARIADEFPQTRLVVTGKSYDLRYHKKLRIRSEKLNLKERVTFLEPMTQSDLAREMASSEVLVLPSLSEGLGRVVFEAMACGTPVIGSAVGGIPDMIQDGQTGLLSPPGSVPALTEKIRWILEHPEEASAMGRRARIFAQNYFSVDLYVQGYQDLFNAVSSAQS